MSNEIKPVTIPQAVASVIGTLRLLDKSNEYIAELWMRTGGGVPAVTHELRKVTFETLMRALLDGYTQVTAVSQTEVRADYDSWYASPPWGRRWNGGDL